MMVRMGSPSSFVKNKRQSPYINSISKELSGVWHWDPADDSEVKQNDQIHILSFFERKKANEELT